MSLSGDLEEMRRKVEQVRQEQGDEAAKQYETELHSSYIGGTWGLAGGAIAGAAVGSVIVPGVGTVVGGVIGGFFGLINGVQDKSPLDNLKRAGKVITSVANQLPKK
jgi:phage tail tape-measure protein